MELRHCLGLSARASSRVEGTAFIAAEPSSWDPLAGKSAVFVHLVGLPRTSYGYSSSLVPGRTHPCAWRGSSRPCIIFGFLQQGSTVTTIFVYNIRSGVHPHHKVAVLDIVIQHKEICTSLSFLGSGENPEHCPFCLLLHSVVDPKLFFSDPDPT